jgi:hypothetical protein
MAARDAVHAIDTQTSRRWAGLPNGAEAHGPARPGLPTRRRSWAACLSRGGGCGRLSGPDGSQLRRRPGIRPSARGEADIWNIGRALGKLTAALRDFPVPPSREMLQAILHLQQLAKRRILSRLQLIEGR